MPIVLFIVGLFILFYGLSSSGSYKDNIKKMVKSPSSSYSKSLLEEWEKVDDYLEDCRGVGLVLRQMEAKDQYKIRLFLVVPTKEEPGFILVNDAGDCWVDEKGAKERIDNPEYFNRLFTPGQEAGEAPRFPLLGRGGVWTVLPLHDYSSSVWGALIAQHYQ